MTATWTADDGCEHGHAVSIQSTADLRAPGSHAATYCCDRDACQAAAKAWVRSLGFDRVLTFPLPLRWHASA